MHVLSGSIRTRSAEEAAPVAWAVAQRLGVTRVTDVTWMDRIGIPVSSATRPRAGILRVSAGKGRRPAEAHIGALMESIEQGVAERAAETAAVEWMSARDVVRDGGPTLGSYCPHINAPLDPDRPLAWVIAHDIVRDCPVPVPAELVFIPCPPELTSGYFGSTTTGLASGNTYPEATVHGLCEVLERDISSFQVVDDASFLVRPDSLPPALSEMTDRIRSAGLRTWLRWVPSALGVSYFTCLIEDPDFPTPLFCNGGYGAHPVPVIAATRAITEAAQSRLTYIQGAREDLEDTFELFRDAPAQAMDSYREELIGRYADERRTVRFGDIAGADPAPPEVMLEHLVRHCRGAGFSSIAVYHYAELALPFRIVRVAVPTAEHFTNATQRVGTRLGQLRRVERTLVGAA
ncbi:YcaO-like family protein [Streptomyces sp. DT2A-34]|uniref:YcaO-like family protein n=1 Tax=Streptomyces sp. DT2A-34 TaxID=3051182 RepID=UPI00265BA5F3|nr:YcaO-like family protein [Streptomyces sp. DT2A-34]MDO0917760.1 YcaO-like family protein [Streptomyces sp. DT2A-34]